jgi:quinohemoprotein ethanol dehydrogenase
MKSSLKIAGLLSAAALATALIAIVRQHGDSPPLRAEQIDDAGIGLFEQDVGSWLATGRSHAEQRYSPLAQIDTTNVSRLGLAWEADLQSGRFGIEATPLVADGVLYITSTWSRVFAFDAKSGRKLWSFDPQVKRDWLRNGCCKPVNRGAALWKGRLYVAAFDGRLIALDARSGQKLWEADTTDAARNYTITGAPRVAAGKVLIGNAGADLGARGYVSAYDADSGALAWRFYVVPGKAGGNPWDSISYDPQLGLVYVGTGNGFPWSPELRNADDERYLSSILAIHVDSGGLAWHYQVTPGDRWDFDATQQMMLADLDIGGRKRRVLMQASKNGFYYVLDRASGELISADPFVRANWASGVDPQTGRPMLSDDGDYRRGVKLVLPGPYGAHNWMPMSFSPRTGLVYIPIRDIGWIWGADVPTWFLDGYDLARLQREDERRHSHGALLAWDPVARKPAWSVVQGTISNGATLSTAGNLVVQGTEDGHIRFHDARDGRLLHELFVGTGVVAPPISYAVDGEQYIAVATGWNGVRDRIDSADSAAPYDNNGHLLVLKLGGGAVPVAKRIERAPLIADDTPQSREQVAKGATLYLTHCATCHGVMGEGSVFPDLRRLSPGMLQIFPDIVLGGALRGAGMASFDDVLNAQDVDAIRAYVIDWAQRTRRGEQPQSAADAPANRKGI